jgi:hypothetical protein
MTNTQTVGVFAGVALLLAFLGKKLTENAGAVAATVKKSLDPTSTDNLAYKSVNAVGAVVADDKNFTLGGAIYDFFHPSISSAEMRPTIALPQYYGPSMLDASMSRADAIKLADQVAARDLRNDAMASTGFDAMGNSTGVAP